MSERVTGSGGGGVVVEGEWWWRGSGDGGVWGFVWGLLGVGSVWVFES